jgi:transglutaminase-like putative cysteine protease
VYLFVSLYCCLLFHLKVEADVATAALPLSREKLSPETLRQDQRHLGRSMRRLTGAVAVVGVASAVGVFVIFPRGPGGALGPLQQFHNPLTGFSDNVSFGSVAAIGQSHEKVAFVKLWHDDQLITGTQTLLLRGVTLDHYSTPMRRGIVSWDWTHTPPPPAVHFTISPNHKWGDFAGPVEAAHYRQQITLWPTSTSVIFALAGVRQVIPGSTVIMNYTPEDGSLHTKFNLKERLEYEVRSTGVPEPLTDRWSGPLAFNVRAEFPDIAAYARRPEVCGREANGTSLGDTRVAMPARVTPLDARIASNIERYLQTNFSYTLDLSNAERLGNREPLYMFLNTWKRGHCEYFAGAMTLLCQSLGLEARMVIGFKCGPENYNDFTQSYTVYDSDAHAWVEVNTPNGWETYDPTSSRNSGPPATGLATEIRHMIEYLEFNYANAIIAYDAQSRLNLITWIENSANSGFNRILDLFASVSGTSTLAFTSFGVLALILIALAVAWFLWGRWKLLRRAQRIGIESLPPDQKLHLARQLGFYDDLVRLLEHHQIVRPAHFTPLEFGRSLAFLPADMYDKILRLTRLFYEVRYGGAELTQARLKRVTTVVDRLAAEMAESNPSTNT